MVDWSKREPLEAAIGHTFVDRGLLVRALTHRSWIEEQHPGQGAAFAHEGQERLEFLGDAFLGYVVARALFDAQEMAGEGDLTVSRAGKVSREALTAVGERIQVVRYLRLGVGERMKAGENKNLAADTVEAIVGAVLLDAGEVRAREVVLGLVGEAVAEADGASVGVADDVITRANLRHQQLFRAGLPKPVYERVEGSADHAPRWRAVQGFGADEAEGFGATKQEARVAACRAVLGEG